MRERRRDRKTARAKREVLRAFDRSLQLALAHGEADPSKLGESVLRLSRKLNVRLGRPRNLFICKKCGTMLIPGRTGRYRVHSERGISYLGIKCLSCGWYRKVIIRER